MRRPKLADVFGDNTDHDSSRFASATPQPLRAALSGKNITLLVLVSAVSISSIAFATQSNSTDTNQTSLPPSTPKSGGSTTLTTEADTQVQKETNTGSPGLTDPSTQPNSNATNSNVSVSVNGQSVEVPANGSTHEIITTPDGTTSVNVSNSQSSNGSSYNASFTTTNTHVVQSSVNQNVRIDTQTGANSP